MTNKSIPSAFVKNVLHNGVGRYVCQLQRLTLNFCKSHASSRGVRDFIENHLLEFTRNNPGVVVYLKPRRHKHPKLVATYLNGYSEDVPVVNKPVDEVCKWVEFMKTRSGVKIVRLQKMWHTDTPSIQGMWHPFLNKDTPLNVTEFPSEKYSKFNITEPSTSDKLTELSKSVKNLTVSEGETSIGNKK